jgi:serine/threonine-protein kinase HipA
MSLYAITHISEICAVAYIDLATFMRANIAFWLIGATDGHAKNFSIFLAAGGGFRMAPLYDVLSAQPSLDTGQIQRKKFRLAMSVGKARRYAINDIMPRHFIQTAELSGVSAPLVQSIFDDLAQNAVRSFEEVVAALPSGFPAGIADSIGKTLAHRLRLLDIPAKAESLSRT